MEILKYKEEMVNLLHQYNGLVKTDHKLDTEGFRGHIESEGEEEHGSGHLKISHKDTISTHSEIIKWELY